MDYLAVLLSFSDAYLSERINLSIVSGNTMLEKRGSIAELLNKNFSSKEFTIFYSKDIKQVLWIFNQSFSIIHSLYSLSKLTMCVLLAFPGTEYIEVLSYLLALTAESFSIEARSLINIEAILE